MTRSSSRTKSCGACRLAKSRCSLEQPCSRCVDRQLECRYITGAASTPTRNVYRQLEPARKALPESPAYAELPDSGGLRPATLPQAGYLSPSSFDQTSSPSDAGRRVQHLRGAPPYVAATKVLSLRSRSDAQDKLTANILFSQLKVYPQMLAEGSKLPPFIFPPCFLSIEGQCPSDTTHICLPEILAICASLTQMFISRTPGSVDFVWKQIHAEVRRLRDCHQDLCHEDKLNGLQALLIYSLLQANDQSYTLPNDSGLIVSTSEAFSRDLFTEVSVTDQAEDQCGSRRERIFVESLRRIGTLLYIIDLTLVTGGQNAANGECPAALCVPLPCSRVLWETVSNTQWQKYDQIRRRRPRTDQLTLGNLLLLRNSGPIGNSGKELLDNIAQYLIDWSQEADDFGLLLWMATSLEGNEQTLLRNIRDPK
ncbi:hypothetical protein CC79DRAFT_1402167 [Sarocladium strictum]